jgi:FkbM family methyltransferase
MRIFGKRTLKYNPENFVRSLYEQLLSRTPTPKEVAGHVKELRDGSTDAAEMVAHFVESEEYAQLGSAGQSNFINANDQFGEIALLLREWASRSVTQKIVVDVGARGRERSNSWDLIKHFGWRGLLVEANPSLLPIIRKDFSGLDYTLVGAAVSDFNGSAEFTIGSNDDVSSLDAAVAASWGQTRGTVQVDVRRLPEVLAEHGIPLEFGLLSLDIEGEDIKVLADTIAGSAYRPDYVIVEASQNFQNTSLQELDLPDIVCDTYEIFAQTRANLLLRRIGAQTRSASAMPVPGPQKGGDFFSENCDLIISRGVSGGYWITHRNDEVIGRSIRQAGQFQEQAIDEVLKILDCYGHPVERNCFVDIGANIGTHSIRAARLGFIKVISFEPNPQNFRLLRSNCLLHDLEQRINCHQMAISHQDGTMQMELSPSNFGDHRLRINDKVVKNVHDEEQWTLQDVAVRTFDSLVAEGLLPKKGPDLIWIDTQGHEGHVLACAASLKEYRCPVVLEFWPYGLERAGGYPMLRDALLGLDFMKIVDLSQPNIDELTYLSLQDLDQIYESLRAGESKQSSPHTDLLLIPS